MLEIISGPLAHKPDQEVEMNAPIITIENLTRRFDEKITVDNLSLEVRTGEVFGFLGHNGAGKTTTVRLLNGVLEPHRGMVRVLGLDPIADGPALRARTGVLTETASLDTRLSARDNLQIYADLFGVPREEVNTRVDEFLSFFDLHENANAKVATFSTGMRQRLALARTLLHDPEILFLDEPTSGLDPLAAHQVNELIANLANEKGRTVFLCTHNLVEAQKLCDRVAVLEHGHLVALGNPAELARQYVRHLDVEIETAAEQTQGVFELLSKPSPMIRNLPIRKNGYISVTVAGREAIPDLLNFLTSLGIRVYRLASREPTLEDVYFALHGEKESKQ
jgi:ABC-2 type transport system ATP-binding protein